MGRPPKFDIDDVLRRATNLLWDRGCDDVSTRDLEKALDLRAPAIYRRFRNKDDLVAHCLHFYIDTVITRRIQRTLDGADDPLEGLHDFFISTLDTEGDKIGLRGCLLATTAAQAFGKSPEGSAAVNRGWRLMYRAFRQQVERAQQNGQIDARHDPDAVAQALLMSLQGLLTLVRAGVTDLRPGIDVTLRAYGWRSIPSPDTDGGS